MNDTNELLERLFEGRDGTHVALSTERARVTIRRLESEHAPTEYRLGGDCWPLQQRGLAPAYATPGEALAVALIALEAYAS